MSLSESYCAHAPIEAKLSDFNGVINWLNVDAIANDWPLQRSLVVCTIDRQSDFPWSITFGYRSAEQHPSAECTSVELREPEPSQKAVAIAERETQWTPNGSHVRAWLQTNIQLAHYCYRISHWLLSSCE